MNSFVTFLQSFFAIPSSGHLQFTVISICWQAQEFFFFLENAFHVQVSVTGKSEANSLNYTLWNVDILKFWNGMCILDETLLLDIKKEMCYLPSIFTWYVDILMSFWNNNEFHSLVQREKIWVGILSVHVNLTGHIVLSNLKQLDRTKNCWKCYETLNYLGSILEYSWTNTGGKPPAKTGIQ